MPPKAPPSTAPMNSDGAKAPPALPEPRVTAVASDLSPTSTAIRHTRASPASVLAM